MNPDQAGTPRPRIALYSHDTMGLGHIRRNTLLAQRLAASPVGGDILLLSGIRESGAYPLPARIDSITLPAYHKQADGSYRCRALGISLARLVALRSQVIETALSAFEPDLLIVDNVPRGAMNELDRALAMLRQRRTRVVLGLRDIIDTPEAVRRQWRRQDNLRIIADRFDAVWIYGDARVYDTARAYGLDQISDTQIISLGYLDPCLRDSPAAYATAGQPAVAEQAPYALCLVGGGQDGFALAKAFAQTRLPAGWRGIILSGAMMPAPQRQQLRALTAGNRAFEVLDFVNEPMALLRGAEAVVAMAGYNTTMEVLALDKRALLVPRVTPRAEQWLRASRLAELGLADCLHPDALDSAQLSAWLARQCLSRPQARLQLDFNGLDRVAEQAMRLIDSNPR